MPQGRIVSNPKVTIADGKDGSSDGISDAIVSASNIARIDVTYIADLDAPPPLLDLVDIDATVDADGTESKLS